MSSEELLQRAKERLAFDPFTGVFTWKAFGDSRVSTGRRKLGDAAGHKDKLGYIVIHVGSCGFVKAHRLAWAWCYGTFPPAGFEIDHADGNPTNNAIANLRLATKTENARNRKRRKDNTSGIKGVCFHSRDRVWVASIRMNGKLKQLGSFRTKEAAADAYADAAHKLFGNFARLA